MADKDATTILDDEQIRIAISLFRYSLWAHSMMSNFEMVLNRDRQEMRHQLARGQTTFDTKLLESEMYHCLWFGILYVVIEGWPRLRVKNQRITELLRAPHKKLLRNFRNTTFHPENYDDKRIRDLMATGQPSIDWAREVTREFKTFFETLLFR